MINKRAGDKEELKVSWGKRPFNTLSLPTLLLSLSGLWSNRIFTVQWETNKSWSPATLTICLPPDLKTNNKQSIFTAEKTTLSSHWRRSPLPSSTVCCLSWLFSWTRKSWDDSNHYSLDKSGSEICLPRPSEVSRNILELVFCDWNMGSNKVCSAGENTLLCMIF